MALNAYQSASVVCPNCQYRFIAPILTIIDASQNPQAKARLLSGQINVAACPNCGRASVLSTPLVYHDPGKELLFTFVPSELGIPELEQQRIVGDLTNRVISALPVERRKGYLLRPRSFFQLQAMAEAILEADGVTREMLDAQRARHALLERLLLAASEDLRRPIAEANDAQIDHGFFELLAMRLELAEASGQTIDVQELTSLRNQLLEWTTHGKEIAARQEAIQSLGHELTRERLLEKLVEAALAGEEVKVETLVVVGRPAIDYLLYQQLTEHIDSAKRQGDGERAAKLVALRERILDLTAQIDAEVQRATAEAASFLDELAASDDPEALIRTNPERADGLFLDLLAASLDAAARAGDSDKANRLGRIRDVIMKLIDESQPPEIQFINRLLAAEYPEGTKQMLEEHRQLIDPGLLEIMSLVEEGLNARGREDLAQHLGRVRSQAASLML